MPYLAKSASIPLLTLYYGEVPNLKEIPVIYSAVSCLLFAVLLWFDRHSSFLFRFERDRLLRLFRVGPVTVWRTTWSPDQLTGVDALTAESPAPLLADAAGRYPTPQPGIRKSREF